MEEIQQYGAYLTHLSYNHLKMFEDDSKMPIPEREDNPYVDAFWEWWPELYPNLHTFRITGGEPLMTKHTFKVLDYIIANPNPKLELGINSNLGVPKKLINEFINKIKIIHDTNAVKDLTIYTSCEAKGSQAEYIRFGLNYNEWIENCNLLLSESPKTRLIVMSTYNALSVNSYTEFLSDFLEIKKKYVTPERWVGIDIPYLRNPEWMTVGVLTADFLPITLASLEYMRDNKGYYTNYEIDRMQRVYDLFASLLDKPIQELEVWRKDFALFMREHDKRRGTDFLNTFPNMKEFYNLCLA